MKKTETFDKILSTMRHLFEGVVLFIFLPVVAAVFFLEYLFNPPIQRENANFVEHSLTGIATSNYKILTYQDMTELKESVIKQTTEDVGVDNAQVYSLSFLHEVEDA